MFISEVSLTFSGSSIKFQDVISVIAKFAFIVTPYPLILSMEIHCGTDQQLKMAKIFKETLGRELLLDPLEGMEEGKLPSPEQLKYKILLKVGSTRSSINSRSKIRPKMLMKSPRILEPTPQNQGRSLILLLDPKARNQVSPGDNLPVNQLPPKAPRFPLFCPRWQFTQKHTSGGTSRTPIQNCTTTCSVSRNQGSRN